MYNLYMPSLLALCSIFFSKIHASETSKEVVVQKGHNLKIIVSERPLALGSLKIVSNGEERNFTDWKVSHEKEAYGLIQDIVNVWQEKGITDYLIYAKESETSKSFNWEIVPYAKKGFRFWKQFKVLWNMTFGGSVLPQVTRERVAIDFQKNKKSFSKNQLKEIELTKEVAQKKDAFCNPQVIENQQIFEGKSVRVLYNYAPITLGEGKLHFLIVPKEHRPNFSDLTEEEYLETMALSQKLIKFYRQKGYATAYLFDKSGSEAGQTVPHWHEHLVFTATKTEDVLGRLKVLKNMMIGSSPLPKKELEERIQALKKELSKILN